MKFFRIFWAHGHTLSHYDNSNSVAWCFPNRTRTWVELWVEHWFWLISTDSLETTSIWTTLEYVNTFMTSGKYTSFVEIQNNCGKRKKEKHCCDDSATYQIRWEISLNYPIAIDNYLTAFFSVVSWNQIPWIGVRFTISRLIAPAKPESNRIALSAYEDEMR